MYLHGLGAGDSVLLTQALPRMAEGWGDCCVQMPAAAPATAWAQAAAGLAEAAMLASGLSDCSQAPHYHATAAADLESSLLGLQQEALAAAADLVATCLGLWQEVHAVLRVHQRAAIEASGMHCQGLMRAGEAKQVRCQAVLIWKGFAAWACAAMEAERVLDSTHQPELA